MLYQKEIFKNHIKFVKDTDENRKLVEDKFGKSKFIFDNYSYIEINLKEKTWRTCLDFEWLYRNQPPLISIEELLKL